MAKPPRFRQDGEIDGRGHADASKSFRFASGDGRKRPGRPKGARDERTEVLLVRDMPVEITIGGKKRKGSTRLGMYMRQRHKALNGDQRATEFLDAKFSQFEPPLVQPDLTRILLEEDRAILAAAAGRGIVGPDLVRAMTESHSGSEEDDDHDD